MSLPTTKAEFKEYCLRRLGHNVINIEVSEEQIDDRVEDALAYWNDYHFDGTEKIYYKHQITANNRANAVHSLTLVSGGSGYSNSDTITISDGNGTGATGTITVANGIITAASLTNCGSGFVLTPDVTITTANGTGASIRADLGGKIIIPENIIGIVNIFDVGTSFSTANMFNIQYQIALNELWSISNVQLAPYYIARQHLNVIQEILVGKKPIRYNRHRNELFVDMNWSMVNNGDWLIIEAYQIIDPDVYPNVWKDRWLLQYGTQLIKRQWGEQLKKYGGVVLLGGVQFNGQEIYNEAVQEIMKLEAEMLSSFSLPVSDMIG